MTVLHPFLILFSPLTSGDGPHPERVGSVVGACPSPRRRLIVADQPPRLAAVGPHRALLDFFDQIHREHGCKSFERLSTDMGKVSRAPGLAASRIHAILRGSLPTSDEQTRLIVLATIGTDDPTATAKATKAAQLYAGAEQAQRDTHFLSGELGALEPAGGRESDADVSVPSIAADPPDGSPPWTGAVEPRRRTRAVLLAAAAGLLCAVAVVSWLLWPADPDSAALDVGVTGDGISCSPLPDAAVRIAAIAADDGRAGVAKYNTVTVDVLRANPPGHTYWLLAHVFEVGDVGPYIAKQRLFDDIGTRTYGLQLDSQVDSVREIFIVEADPDSTAILRRNNELPMDGSQDQDTVRMNRPPVPTVSATCRVTKTRDEP